MALSAAQLKLLESSRGPVIAPTEEEERSGLSQAQLIQLGRGDDQADSSSPYLESVDKASYNDPDKMIEAIALEQETSLPVEIINEDPEEAKRLAWVKSQGLDMEADEDSPRTTEWLSDPDKATVAKDDYSNLRDIEKNIRQQESYDGMEFQDLGNIVEAWVMGFPKMGKQLEYYLRSDTDTPIKIAAREERKIALAEGNQERVDEIDATFAAETSRMADLKEEIDFISEEQGKLTPTGDFIAESIHGGGTMALDLAPGMLISALTKGKINPTLPFLTSKVFADASYEALAEGRGYYEASRYAVGQAGLEYIFEKIPVKMLEKITGDLGGSGNVRGTLKRWFATEALTEQGAEITQTIHSYINDLDDEMTNASSWGERAEIQARRQAVVLMSTIIGGGGVSATVHGLDRAVGRKQRANREAMKKAFERTSSEQSQGGLDELFSLAQSSKTNERDAAYLEDHINNVAPEGRIFLSADAVDAMDVVPDYITAQLDGSRADIVIPLSRFVRDFAGDAAKLNEVRRYIKTAGHLQTLEELEANTDSTYIARVIDEAAKAQDTKDEADRIYDQIVQQMVDTGRHSQLTARQSAQLIPAVITTHYEELKKEGKTNPDGSEITVEQLFADMGLEIVGPQVEVGSKEFTNQMQQEAVEDIEQRRKEAQVVAALGDQRKAEWTYLDYENMAFSELQREAVEQLNTNVETGQVSSEATRVQKYIAALRKVNTPLAQIYEKVNEKFTVELQSGTAARDLGRKIEIDTEFDAELAQAEEGIFETPRVLNQEDLSNITIEETAQDEDGNLVTLKESALTLYQTQQDRMAQVEQLRGCVGG